jgi:hypothetical protein
VGAFACDLTRVATLHFANGHSHDFPWLWAKNGGPIVDTLAWENWHAMVHADFQPGMEWVYRWYLEMLADLLTQLIAHGAPLQLVPMQRWLEAIAADPANPLHGIRAFFFHRWGEEQLTYPELNQAGVRARPSCAATTAALAALGVQCPSFGALIGPYGRSLLGSGAGP